MNEPPETDIYDRITAALHKSEGLTLAELKEELATDAPKEVSRALKEMERVKLVLKVERDGLPPLRRMRPGW